MIGDTATSQLQSSNVSIFGLQSNIGYRDAITVISVYVRPDTSHDDFNLSLSWIKRHVSPSRMRNTYIMGDFNAYHLTWALPVRMDSKRGFRVFRHFETFRKKHNRGKSIVRFAAETGLKILNNTHKGPTFHHSQIKGATAYIDLALA